jgi:CUE domain
VDILPHLGDGFVEACLAAYDWDVERTVSAILNNDLPPELATMNQSKKRYFPPKIPHLT